MTLTEWMAVGGQLVSAWVVLIGVAIFYRFLERKALADIEARIGPRRVGAAGLFQPVADWAKMLTKSVSSLPFKSGSIIVCGCIVIFSSLSALPLGGGFPLLQSPLNSCLPLILFFLVTQLFAMVDLRSGEIISVLNGARRLILFFGFFLPALLSVLHVYLLTGGASWELIAERQQGFVSWNAVSGPLGALSAFVFIICGVALSCIHPFSIIRSTPGQSRFTLTEDFVSFFSFFLWSVMTVGFFFGGNGSWGEWLPNTPFSFWLIFKVLILMMMIRMLGGSFAKLRLDQMVRLAWGFLVPLSAIVLMAESLWIVKKGLG